MKRIALCLSLLALCVAVHAGEMHFVKSVIDGDTIKVVDMYGLGQTVRLIGIDTPECQHNHKAYKTAYALGVTVEDVVAAGREARAFVRQKLHPGGRVRVVVDGRGSDDYDRVLAYVITEAGECINETLIREGYAQAFRNEDFARRSDYLALERRARREGRNFWSTIWKRETR